VRIERSAAATRLPRGALIFNRAVDKARRRARTSLGNVLWDRAEGGEAAALWCAVATDCFVTLVLLVLASYGAGSMEKLINQTDRMNVTMADYVRLRFPLCPRRRSGAGCLCKGAGCLLAACCWLPAACLLPACCLPAGCPR
jgi:hypothetical protein